MASISAIIPAYNEFPRIAHVLETLTSYGGFEEIIVVDDGSEDNTAERAGSFNVRVIRNEKNFGKGAALDKGARQARGDILFFCDADITGLSHEVIDRVVGPVLRGEVDMFVASRDRTRYSAMRFALITTPFLDGQRALTRNLWNRIPSEFKQCFEIETALNYFAQRGERGFGVKVFQEISQITKEEKYGFLKGKIRRFVMYYQIMRANVRLRSHYAKK